MNEESQLDRYLANLDGTTARGDGLLDLLRDGIVSGALPPGMVLRQERVAQALGISKIPLREALARLETEGFVASTPGRGVAVTSIRAGQVEEIFELRQIMEVQLLAAAIPRLTPEALAEARQGIADFDSAPVHQLSRINWRIHSALYRPSGRELSLEILRGLFLHAERFVRLHMATLDQDRTANRDHERLVDACERGRVAEACGILRDHLDSIGRTICDYAAEHAASTKDE